jgi:hypothetical protein
MKYLAEESVAPEPVPPVNVIGPKFGDEHEPEECPDKAVMTPPLTDEAVS